MLAEKEERNFLDVVRTFRQRRQSKLAAFEKRQQLGVESARRRERRRAVGDYANIRDHRVATLARAFGVREDFCQPGLQVGGQPLDFFEI